MAPPSDTQSGPNDEFADWEKKTARFVVRAFVTTRGSLRSYDTDDLVQEALLYEVIGVV